MATVEPILPECEIDTALVESLVRPTTRYNHQYGCDNVVKAMRQNYADDFALGIIDKDKRKVDYLSDFVLVREIAGELILWKHPTAHHYLIQICPAIEKWLLKRADESGLLLTDYNLPHDLAALCKVTKNIVSQKDPKLKAVFKALKESENSVVITLINWIAYLKENTFNADLAKLKTL